MPAKTSEEIKIRIVHATQKNGDIYVLERKTIYALTVLGLEFGIRTC